MSSFFGFDTTLPEDNGALERDTEEAYDALNDETFGHATREDWEPLHEELARIETSRLSKNDDSDDYDSDLDINFDRLKLDDCDIANDDFDTNIRTQLDPSVWTCSEKSLLTAKPLIQKVQNPTQFNNVFTEADFLRQSYALQQQQFQQQKLHMQSMGSQQQQQNQLSSQQSNLAQQTSLLKQLIGAQTAQSQPPGMMSLEEIERNMINQQQHKMIQEKLAELQAKMPQQPTQQQQQLRNLIANQQQKQPAPPANQMPQQQQQGPPLMSTPPARQTMFPPHPLLNPVPRIPPGFPPNMPPGPNMGKFNPNMIPMPNHPMNMNHFVHPSGFNGPIQRPQQPPQQMPQNQMNRMPPHLMNMQQQHPTAPHMNMPPNPIGTQNANQNQNQNTAQFNQRLVQEIQQNHPMLSFNRNQQQQHQQQQQFHHNHNHHHNQHNMNGNHQHQQRYNMKLDEFDEYANLMTTREKQFLITIQMMQLNTDTPYFDDFYFTVYKERQKEKGINSETSAHKDNQMNHPFTQPKDHAHMLLRQFGNLNMNKNGMNKNGIRERKNSESSTKNDQNNKEQTPRTYTPLQFENSLGKLQCGSVTAPRKIIDMEIIDNSEGGNAHSLPAIEPSTQRKSKQLLLHIETLFKIVLKLEDLQNPMAISAAIILKEKREKDKLEKEKVNEFEENTVGTMKSDVLCSASSQSSVSINEPEGLNELMPKLMTLMQMDKVTGMMTVRKGRVLLTRIMPHLKDNPIRWDVWNVIFSSLTLMKREKLEEIEDTLMPLYFEFAAHLQNVEFKDVLKVTHTFVSSPKLLGFVNGCKFVVSTIIALIIQSELLYIKSSDYINQKDQDDWLLFLTKLCEATSSANLSSLTLAYSLHKENNNEKVIKTVITHLQRFSKISATDSDKLVKILSLQYDVK